MKKTVDKEESLLSLLQTLYPDTSKSALRSWIRHERVTIDGAIVIRADCELKVGQEVKIWPASQPAQNHMRILYEDGHLVVIDKPAGLLSVATDYILESAHRYLKARYPQKKVGVVHRLDRETSGLMLFSLSDEAYMLLKEQLKKRSVQRTYAAIVQPTPESEEGTWQTYLEEESDFHVTSSSDPERGEIAITHYRVLKKLGPKALLQLKLQTGRKHQIRVHCQVAGCSIVGDKRYGGVQAKGHRLYLHSQKLEFHHPITEKLMSFETPLPQEFTHLIGI